MQNSPFLALLRPIFALETKIAHPLLKSMGDENWSRTKCDLDQKNFFSLSQELRPFFFFFFLGDHLKLDRKTVPILVKTFFLGGGRSPYFGQKNRLNLIKDRSKSRSRSFDVVSSLQNSPPPNANSWLRA